MAGPGILQLRQFGTCCWLRRLKLSRRKLFHLVRDVRHAVSNLNKLSLSRSVFGFVMFCSRRCHFFV